MRGILLVEDDRDCRESLGEILETMGFRVVLAEHGTAALRLWLEDPQLDFALCDLSLPDVNGAALAERLRHLRPDARIAILSGYDSAVTGAPEGRFDEWFRKPIDIDEILRFLLEADQPETRKHT